jgi:predicted RNA binding protein YcfA (HicA-like mRNA interferase family)
VPSINITDTTAPPPTTSDTIHVKPKTVKFFKRMFSCLESAQRSTDWQELVAAMLDSGFSATHSGGSLVTFEDERNKKGSIVLHKPHPETTVDYIMLRTIGKRLTKWFGWGGGTFVGREKDHA